MNGYIAAAIGVVALIWLLTVVYLLNRSLNKNLKEKPQLEKVEGFVFSLSLEKYRSGVHKDLYIWSQPISHWGITGIPVTLYFPKK